MNKISEDLLMNEEFLKKTLPLTAEEAKKAFEAEGGEITIEELQSIADQVNKIIAKPGAELSEDDLDGVAGGASTWQTVKFVAGVAVGIAVVCYPW